MIPVTYSIKDIIESSGFAVLILFVILVTLMVLLGFHQPIVKMIADNAGQISRMLYS
ncbi:MAG: hypothetical protein HZB65_04155 [Candidatus Aenigmarchaeota archaeon]|nr:hypothetical protein [Candidatus Aenigmarchaeota archaeon]